MSRWYFVAAVFDAQKGTVRLYQLPKSAWDGDASRAVVERPVSVRALGANTHPLVIAGAWRKDDRGKPKVGAHFNGKIDAPSIYGRALSEEEIELFFRQGSRARGSGSLLGFLGRYLFAPGQ